MPVRDHTLRIEFIPAQSYDAMKAQYNSTYHTDMEPQHVRIHDRANQPHEDHKFYDGVETWLDRGARAFMKRPPWGSVDLAGACLDEVRELGTLAQVDRGRLDRAVRNATYLPGLVDKIDRCIRGHRESDASHGGENQSTKDGDDDPPLIFCRINECSMKQSTEYTPRPHTSGTSILTSLLTDRRAMAWLSNPLYGPIQHTTLYLSEFDASFKCTNEYRVFVWKGRVTGVSQYRWFVTEETEYHTEESARGVCEDVVMFMESEEGLLAALAEHRKGERMMQDPSAKAETMSDMTLVADVVHTEGCVYLVEINLFGGETGCGSSLFHWKRDESVLYSEGDEIVCRFFARPSQSECDISNS